MFLSSAYDIREPILQTAQTQIRLGRKRKLVALLLLSYRCSVTVIVPWLFLTVPWVGLRLYVRLWYFLIILTFSCLTYASRESSVDPRRMSRLNLALTGQLDDKNKNLMC